YPTQLERGPSARTGRKCLKAWHWCGAEPRAPTCKRWRVSLDRIGPFVIPDAPARSGSQGQRSRHLSPGPGFIATRCPGMTEVSYWPEADIDDPGLRGYSCNRGSARCGDFGQ